MTEELERPKFLPSFFSAMAERAENKTIWRMLLAPIIAAAISAGVSYYMPAAFWLDDNSGVAATVYTGILTLNGLILALSWSAFSRIYESISAPKFCSFLRRNNLLNKYVVTISFIHGLQLLSIVASASGLIALLVEIPYLIVDRILFGVMGFASIYAIQQAASAVAIMNDLLWQKSIFDEHNEAANNPKVVPMGNRSE
jgi:hypothetical protein